MFRRLPGRGLYCIVHIVVLDRRRRKASGGFLDDLRRAGLGSAATLAAFGRGSFSNDVLGGRIEFGWRQQLGCMTLTPFAALEMDHL